MTDLRLYPEPSFNPRRAAEMSSEDCLNQALVYLTELTLAQMAIEQLREAQVALKTIKTDPDVLEVLRKASPQELQTPELQTLFPGMTGEEIVDHIEFASENVVRQTSLVGTRVMAYNLAAVLCWLASL